MMLQAVCFDFKGTLIDHRQEGRLIPGMVDLLRDLQDQGITLAVISRNPAKVVRHTLGDIQNFFGDFIYSGGGEGKLTGIITFANVCGIEDLARIAFVDDKPDNLLPTAEASKVFVIGFRGSGKYPHTETICEYRGIPYANSVKDLRMCLIA